MAIPALAGLLVVKCDTIFRFILEITTKSNFARYCGNTLKVWWKVLFFVGKLLLFPAVKELGKSVKN